MSGVIDDVVRATESELPLVMLDDDGVRRFEMSVPKGWRAFDVDGLLALLQPAVECSWFRTNVTVSRDVVPADADVAEVMAVCERRLDATYDAAEIRGAHDGACGDAPALVHLRAFDVRADAVRLSQLHAVFDAGLVRGNGSHDDARVIYQVIATCLAEDATVFGDAFATMLGSCRVTMSPAGERTEELE